ncbi:MAG: ChaN family lipoprotein, partial [Desertifilum sp. SIO1I2]|nr:ChaN family lipoprotein [Desertifilum sp. SIO1I2]
MKLLQKPILKVLLRKRSFWKTIFGLGFCLLWLIPAYVGADATEPPMGFSGDRLHIIQRLVQADVVYLGEIHNRPEDGQAQLEIIQALAQKGKVAIAMEMFQRPYQAAIDAYLQGEISETQLLEQTEYEQRWRFPW